MTSTQLSISEKVAFQANHAQRSGHYPNGATIIFTRVSLNDGKGYNPVTGIFKVPVSGVYSFTAHLCNKGYYYITFAIKTQHRLLAVSTIHVKYHSTCSPLTTLAKVTKNEEIRVVAYGQKSFISTDRFRVQYFSGFLVNKS